MSKLCRGDRAIWKLCTACSKIFLKRAARRDEVCPGLDQGLRSHSKGPQSMYFQRTAQSCLIEMHPQMCDVREKLQNFSVLVGTRHPAAVTFLLSKIQTWIEAVLCSDPSCFRVHEQRLSGVAPPDSGSHRSTARSYVPR